MLTREEAYNLLDESKNELVEMLCNMSYQIDTLNDKLTAKDEEIERLKVEISQMKCCENCEFQPNSECRFNTQYGCLDDIFPSNWKLKRSKQ